MKKGIFQIFANSISKAVAYIKEPSAIYDTLKLGLLTVDLEASNQDVQFIGTDTVKYQHIDFGDNTLGSFDKAAGYGVKDLNLTWKTLTLTQDKGDSIKIDRMDDEEACANGIVKLANRYILTIQAPAIDKYRFGKILAANNTFCQAATPTDSTILAKFLHGKARLENARVDVNNLICYIAPAYKELLKAAAIKQGYFLHGNWGGNLDAEVEMVDGIKLVSVPQNILGAGVCFIILHPNAVWARAKYQETEFFDKIPGFGGRKMQADIGVYHDAFVYDELNRAIYVQKTTAATTYTVTYAAGAVGNTSATTVSAATQAATAADGEFTIASLTSSNYTLSGKTIAGVTDGYNFYNLGDTYVMPAHNVTLTVVWK